MLHTKAEKTSVRMSAWRQGKREGYVNLFEKTDNVEVPEQSNARVHHRGGDQKLYARIPFHQAIQDSRRKPVEQAAEAEHPWLLQSSHHHRGVV